jgi:hypothetical protein
MRPLTEFGVLAEGSGAFTGAIVSWAYGDAPFTLRAQRWDGNGWVDVAASEVNGSAMATNRVLAVAMPRNALTVGWLEASPVAANGVGVSVSSASAVGGWPPFPLSFPFLGDVTLGSLAVEMVNGAPIVVVTRRNAAGDYRWHALRYYP